MTAILHRAACRTFYPIPILCALLSLAGCSTFVTTQTDLSTNPDGTQRTITTKAKATTFWDSGSALANFKASQTDKTQSATVGSLNQFSTATNVSQMTGEILGAAIRAAVKP
jgi:hypothetical protein